MKHARASASAAHRWMVCAGSVNEAAKYPGTTTSYYAAEGTVAHNLAANVMTGRTPSAASALGNQILESGHLVTVDQEMVDGVNLYADAVRESLHADSEVHVEFDLTPALQKLDQDLGGNSDLLIYRQSEKLLSSWDFKYGAGIPVEVKDNEQLLIYAVGALLVAQEQCLPVQEVEVVIVQPRYDHPSGRIRRWKFAAIDILEFVATLIEKVRATRLPDAPLVAGSHCRYCPAAGGCPELERSHHAMVATEFGVLAIDPVKLSKALDMIPELEARIKAVRELGYTAAIQGNPPPGYKLVNIRPTRKWKDSIAIKAFAPPEWYETTLRSAPQVEKLIGKAKFSELYGEEVEKKSSGFVLVHESDDRPAAQTVAALAGEFEANVATDPLLEFNS